MDLTIIGLAYQEMQVSFFFQIKAMVLSFLGGNNLPSHILFLTFLEMLVDCPNLT